MSERGYGYFPDDGWGPEPDTDPDLLCGYCKARPAIDDGPCIECYDERSPLWEAYHFAGGPRPEIIPPVRVGEDDKGDQP